MAGGVWEGWEGGGSCRGVESLKDQLPRKQRYIVRKQL